MSGILASLRDAARDSLIGGLSLFWLAPMIPLLLLVPEFAQHVAEIRLGMFDSREAAQAVGNSPTRWAFGYVKIAGMFLCACAAARYWGGLKDRWWDLRTIPAGPFAMALAGNIALVVGQTLLVERMPPPVASSVDLGITIVTLPFIVWFIGPLLGDRTMTLRRAYTRGWIALVVMIGLAALCFIAGQWVHTQNHRLAFGAPEAQVWALMIWDSIWTALFVTCAGSALGAGYRHALMPAHAPVGDSQPLASEHGA